MFGAGLVVLLILLYYRVLEPHGVRQNEYGVIDVEP